MRRTATLSHPHTPASSAVLHIELHEALSEPFTASVRFVCDDASLELAAWLWTEASVVLEDAAESARREIHGVVESARYVGRREDLFEYELVLRPRLHGLAYRVRSRIFQDLSVPQIVAKVLKDAGIPDEAVDASGLGATYSKREYCTQWKESELAFVSRLLQEEGIFFYTDFSEDSHRTVLVDAQASLPAIAGELQIPFSPWGERAGDSIRELVWTSRLVPGQLRKLNWDWESPAAPKRAGAAGKGLGASLEAMTFESRAHPQAGLDRHAHLALARAQVARRSIEGVTDCWRLSAGHRFELVGANPSALAGEYVVREIHHVYERTALGSGISGGGEYRAQFSAFPADIEFRPALTVPRPRVHGKESAVVTGIAGEEIHVDAFGRVKVHFFWDREGALDDHSSCWLRVQQQNTSGSMILPRVGWEVAVGFLHGDPDCPVVLQKLYNAETAPPYALPDNLAQSSWQSSSTPGGGGTNELRMNDAGGAMELALHSARDVTLHAGHDFKASTKVNETVQVGTDLTDAVTGTEDRTVTGNQTFTIHGARVHETVADQHVEVTATETVGIAHLHTVTVGGNRTETIGVLHNVLAQKVTETFKADSTRKVGGALSFTTATALTETVQGMKTENVGGLKLERISKSKVESVVEAKVHTALAVQVQTGKDLSHTTEGGLAITTGGPMTIQCDGDFALTGKSVTFTTASFEVDAGGKLKMTPASAKLTGGKIGGDGGTVDLKGTIKYR